MASNIDNTSIDATFPVAGIDNDTQGFRDNFAVIKDNFTIAKDELSTLQNDTVKLNNANNFQGTYIIDANLQSVTQKVYKPGTYVGDAYVNFTAGHYQLLQLDPPTDNLDEDGDRFLTFTLANWPAGADTGNEFEDRFAKMTVELFVTDTGSGNIKVNWAIEGSGTLLVDDTWRTQFSSKTVLLDSEDPYIFEFWTHDGGQTVYGNYLGKYQ